MTDSAITKKSKRSIWIPLLVLITLAACATAGYSYWRMAAGTFYRCGQSRTASSAGTGILPTGYLHRESG